MLESLENRQLLFATLNGELLIVDGTEGDDSIVVRIAEDDDEAFLGVRVNDQPEQFYDFTEFDRIRILAGAGDDTVEVNLHTILALPVEGGTHLENVTLNTPVVVRAGIGDDNVQTYYERDTIFGGLGNDTLMGNGLRDVLRGGAGNDSLNGGGDNDTLRGGAGDDTLDGGGLNDLLIGGDGLDEADYSQNNYDSRITLDGKRNDGGMTSGECPPGYACDIGLVEERDNVMPDIEIVSTGAGDDFIKGSASDNYLYGGDGNDTIVGKWGNDLISGGDGTDIVDYSDMEFDILVTLDNKPDDGLRGGPTPVPTPTFPSILVLPEYDNVLNDIEIVLGGRGNDRLIGADGAERLVGGPGDDYLEGAEGEDTLVGGKGDDQIDAFDFGPDQLIGGDGSDSGYVDEEGDQHKSVEVVIDGPIQNFAF